MRAHPKIKLLLKKGDSGSSLYQLESPSSPETSATSVVSRPAYSFIHYPEHQLIDTTGAGDTFTGAFAVKMLENPSDYGPALEFAN